jgi:hypothetical protein
MAWGDVTTTPPLQNRAMEMGFVRDTGSYRAQHERVETGHSDYCPEK